MDSRLPTALFIVTWDLGWRIAMERLLYWTLFVAGVMALAAWLPAKSACYPTSTAGKSPIS